MLRAFQSIAFWTALIVSASLLAIAAAATAWAVYTRIGLPAEQARLGSLSITYGVIVMLSAAIFSGVLFGWGRERREARDLRQRVAALNNDLREPGERMAADPAPR